jgi:hypothetical protein
MDIWIAILFFLAHLTIAITLTRIRAEVGLPIHSTTFIGPHHSLISLLGTRKIGANNLTWFSLFFWFNRDNRSHPMPHQLEAFKLSEQAGVNLKGMSRSMLLLIVIAIVRCARKNRIAIQISIPPLAVKKIRNIPPKIIPKKAVRYRMGSSLSVASMYPIACWKADRI